MRIRTECACCGRALDVTADQRMRFEVHSRGARPLLFMPRVDWGSFDGPNILRVY